MWKSRLISRFGLALILMTAAGMGTAWLLLSSEATEGARGFGAVVTVALLLAVGLWLGKRLVKPVNDIQTDVERALTGWKENESDAETDEWIGLRKALQYIATHSQERFHLLETERAKSTAILDSMTEGVIALDERGHVVLMNPAARRILHFSDDSGETRTLLEVVRHRGLAELLERCQSREHAEPCKREIEWHVPALRVLEVNAMPVPFSSQARGVLLVFHDVTELRRLETVRAEFVANVSHELRTPLTAIKGCLETLLDEAPPPSATHRRFLEVANGHAERLGRLVNDLLNLSDIETGKVVLYPRAVPLRAFVSETAAMFVRDAAKKDVHLVNQVPADLSVQADRDRLSQILVNLVDNAVKYTPKGGRVRFLAAEETGHVRLTIQDTGQGIPASELPRVTERFYRVDKARSRGEGGTGLGLAIVKHLVQLHGGTLQIDSEYGKGTTIAFLLPVAPLKLFPSS